MANISLEYLCRIFPLNICDSHAGLFPEYFHGIFVTAPPASPTYKASGQHCTVKPGCLPHACTDPDMLQ